MRKNCNVLLGNKKIVDEPTRIRKDENKTSIDMVFANLNVNCVLRKKPKVTDHSGISIDFNTKERNGEYREFISKDYKKFHIRHFLQTVQERLNRREESEVNSIAENFVRSAVSALDIVAPKKKFEIPRMWEGKKWYSEDIRTLTKIRDEAYIMALYTNNKHDWLQFKIERNMAVKTIKRKNIMKIWYTKTKMSLK
ncbi:hypothetical protein WA026_004105 [Henosepilachna vigintioctopunctata]|uniref:Uncharacterized protein n=1 Tax=Henosepilachna vigintioctopunctata TaxID=420089 RepID=A0AAW1UE28_9CUCU